MMSPADLLRQYNDNQARIPLSDKRIDELPIELAQFSEVAERVRPHIGFDQEIADFRRVLQILAWEE